MKLFYFYIGGSIAGALVELHDVRFAAAEKIEDAFDGLRNSWWGKPESLHLDGWGELEYADGYDISLKTIPYAGAEKLWFVNLGGYDPAQFTELHKNVFVVAPTAAKAKVRALQQIRAWRSHHMDGIFEVEHIHPVAAAAALPQGLHLHLEKTDTPKSFRFELGYWAIGKEKMIKSVVKK